MLFSCLVYLLLTGQDTYTIVQQMFTGIDTFTLMAIPFFMLAGELMVYSGTAERLLKFANISVGRFRGGLGYVNVLATFPEFRGLGIATTLLEIAESNASDAGVSARPPGDPAGLPGHRPAGPDSRRYGPLLLRAARR